MVYAVLIVLLTQAGVDAPQPWNTALTTIILTVLGIILTAAVALMVFFYGGDALNAGSVRAEASTISSHLTQLRGAVDLYEAETGTKAQPGSISYLVPLYMKSMPINPIGAGWYYDARMADSYQARNAKGMDVIVAGLPPSDHGKDLCTALARTYGTLGQDGNPIVTSSAASLPASPMGCFDARNWGEITGVYVTYVRVR